MSPSRAALEAAAEAEQRARAALVSPNGSHVLGGFDEWLALPEAEREVLLQPQDGRPLLGRLSAQAAPGQPIPPDKEPEDPEDT